MENIEIHIAGVEPDINKALQCVNGFVKSLGLHFTQAQVGSLTLKLIDTIQQNPGEFPQGGWSKIEKNIDACEGLEGVSLSRSEEIMKSEGFHSSRHDNNYSQ